MMTAQQPDRCRTVTLRPASQSEAGLFYAQEPEMDRAMGIIGHVRMDFGHRGREFWTTWHPRGPREWNTHDFSMELDALVNQLRESGPLQSLNGMHRYCAEHGGKLPGGWTQQYGYIAESEHYRYYLRCCPVPGDYNGYLICQAKAHDQTGETAL